MAQATARYFEKGKSAFKKKNYDYAVTMFRKVVDLDPGNKEARQLLRQAEERRVSGNSSSFLGKLKGFVPLLKLKFSKSPESVVEHCEDYLESDPYNLNIRIQLAKNLEKLGHPEVGAGELKPLAEHFTEEPRLHKNLAIMYISDGKSEKATPHLKKLRRLKPSDREVDEMLKNAMAESTVQEGGWEDAESTEELRKKEDEEEEAESEKSILDQDLKRPGKIREAIPELKKGIKEATNEDQKADFLEQLGTYYKRLEQYGKAVETFKNVLEIRPNQTQVQKKLGDMKIRKWDKRVEKVKQQLSENPDHSKLKKKLKQVKQKRLQKQIQEYKRRVKEHPTDMQLRFRLGEFLLQANQVDQAIEQLQQAKQDPKVQTQAHSLLGQGFLKKNHVDMAISAFRNGLEAADSAERKLELQYNLARAYMEEEQWNDAREELKQILERDYGFRDASELLEKVKKKL